MKYSGIQYNHLDEWVAKGTYENDKLLKRRIRGFWHEEFDSSELKWKHGALCFEGEVIACYPKTLFRIKGNIIQAITINWKGVEIMIKSKVLSALSICLLFVASAGVQPACLFHWYQPGIPE